MPKLEKPPFPLRAQGAHGRYHKLHSLLLLTQATASKALSKTQVLGSKEEILFIAPVRLPHTARRAAQAMKLREEEIGHCQKDAAECIAPFPGQRRGAAPS